MGKSAINEIKESNASDLKKINDLTAALSSLQEEIQANSDLCLKRSETQKAQEVLQSKEFDEKLAKLEKWLETQKSHIISLETSQESGLKELKKSQDTEIDQLKAKLAELEKLEKENDASQGKKLDEKLSELKKWLETQKSKILALENSQKDIVAQTNKNHAAKINSLESKIAELKKQIEKIEKVAPPADVSDRYQFEVHAGAIVDSIRVNGKQYGSNGGSKNVITVNRGERIKYASFRQAPFRKQACMCQLVFITDKGRKFGPYGYATGDPLYNVEFKGDWTKQIKMASTLPTGFEGKKNKYTDPNFKFL